MTTQPTLGVEDLLLRPFRAGDAAVVQLLAGDERIADTTASIPHPYPDGLAERWIAEQELGWLEGGLASFAITQADSDELMGAASLLDIADRQAELGYWVGVPFWSRGIASTTARCLLDYAFTELRLRRVHARCLERNPASGKVLLRAGFSHIGVEHSVCGYKQQQQPVDLYEVLAA